MRRFYIPPDQMGKDESFIVGDDAHHLRHVLKMKPNELIVVIDGEGGEYRARIASISQRQVRVTILERLSSQTESALELTVAQGYLKDKKMDGSVRQLTELGVTRWVPFLSSRSVPAPSSARMRGRYRRWEKISLESLKQCGRSRVMSIAPLIGFDEIISHAAPYDLKLIFWEASKGQSALPFKPEMKPSSIFLAIGPEGGFGPEEIDHAKANGFKVMGLGPRILKAETAVLAAAVVAQFVYGDM